MTRTAAAPTALVAAAVATALAAWGTFGDDEHSAWEFVVVLAIIGLVTAISLPMVMGTSNAEIRSAARQLASGLRLARSEAVSQRSPSSAGPYRGGRVRPRRDAPPSC